MKRHLFVIHLYAQPEQFLKGVNSNDEVWLVSTHSLFEKERSIWTEKLACTVHFLRFDHWNDVLEDAQLDRKAYEQCKNLIPYTSIYQSAYFKAVAAEKNAFVHQQLIRTGKVDEHTAIKVACGPYELHNLGISRAYWRKAGATLITAHSSEAGSLGYKRITALRPVKWSLYMLKALWLSVRPYRVRLARDGDRRFALLSTKRIKLKEQVQLRTSYIIPILWQWGSHRLSAPIHSNQRLLAMYPFVCRKNMVVIQDAFRPTSYPPYYYANSYNGCHLVAQDKVDERFFLEAGLNVFPVGTLLASKEMKGTLSSPAKAIQSICLSLNHAGNWSSLISRCDTDGLIQSVIPLVRKWSDLRFIIRLHPNSSRPMAEGSGWHQRIKTQIAALQLSNLEVSDRSIEEDWQRADVFLSEYSLSVVDALQYGKLVYFLNLTKRRSFVRDLVEVGFPELDTVEALDNAIAACINDPETARQQLARSISNYNERYTAR